MSRSPSLPSMLQVVLVLGLFLLLAFSFTTLFDLPVHLALFIGWFVVMALGIWLGHDYRSLEQAAAEGIYNGTGAILILLSVGVLTGTWIAGGIVPAIIYSGLTTISPELFLPTTVLICSMTALATGTSWGAAGTAGIAMMGIGQSLGVPAPMTAGAVLSGVYFGDKLSPLSDSVVLASSMSGVDISRHIRRMLPVSLTSYCITLALFTITGLQYSHHMDLEQVQQVIHAMDQHFNIGWHCMIPPIAIVVLLAMNKPAFPTISFGALLGVIWAILFQHTDPVTALRSAWVLPQPDTGVVILNNLLANGGMQGMLGSLAVIVFGLGFGSLLEKTGIIQALAERLEKHINNESKLTGCTLLTAFMGNLLGSAMYVSLILTPRLLINTYDRMKADRHLLSRNTEFGGTLTSGMVPWSDNGIFMTSVLGVATLDYLPYMWLSFTCIGVAMLFSWIKPMKLNMTTPATDRSYSKSLSQTFSKSNSQ